MWLEQQVILRVSIVASVRSARQIEQRSSCEEVSRQIVFSENELISSTVAGLELEIRDDSLKCKYPAAQIMIKTTESMSMFSNAISSFLWPPAAQNIAMNPEQAHPVNRTIAKRGSSREKGAIEICFLRTIYIKKFFFTRPNRRPWKFFQSTQNSLALYLLQIPFSSR